MAWKYNPFTDALDNVGSGGGTSYIDGEVEFHSNLPVTVGSPAVNSAFLVRKGEGLYFISRKPAGIWVRELNNGNLDDWKFAGLFSDLYRDANFRIISDSDVSKELAFSLSGISTGTVRTLTAPDASGRIQVEGRPIGNTTPAAGTFTTLTANNGTLTASAPVLDLAQTWNNAAVAFVGFRVNVTDTASSQNASIAEFQLNGASYLRIQKEKNTGLQCCLDVGAGSNASMDFQCGGNRIFRAYAAGAGNQPLYLEANGGLSFVPINNGAASAVLIAEAGQTLAQRSGTAAQTFRIYNTSTSSNANFERLNFRWASNEFIIDAEAGGTGTLRGIKIGSATSSLLGFYGATPVDRPATVADPAGGGTIDTEARTAINDIIDRLQELGLIA